MSLIFIKVNFDENVTCSLELKDVVLGYIIILLISILVESVVTIVSLRGSILETKPRSSIQYLLYIRGGKYLLDADITLDVT